MSKEVLLEKLTDQTYRAAFISEEIDTGLPMQLRAMREARGWNQKYVAEKMETKQPRFSLMEKTGYGNFSLSTLKKLASIFNVGLIVSFVPYSEMIEFIDGFSWKRLAVPSFADEYVSLERRYARGRTRSVEDPAQATLNFSTATTSAEEFITTGETATSADLSIRSLADANVIKAASQLYFTAAAGSTDARI
ncbi:MAG: helix-turn-helix transcriptional regulator [Acidobacteriia bacterium]|nr:helix-turn-helix transcriptional regulator [Terriglobia bacterium]MBZ5678308.1 helix-turn-helix transcriptional regulator [Terriglobia bacterium]